MKKILAIDVDDTVAELVKTWLSVYNMDYDDNLTIDDITDWKIDSFTKIGDDFYKYLTRELYAGMSMIPNARWGVDEIRKMNPDGRIIFITSNMFMSTSGVKFDWLNNNGFKVSHKDYFEASDKSIIGYDYLIDDNYSNVIDGRGILMSRPWNLKYEFVPRVNNWIDIVHKIRFGDIAKGWCV